MSRRRMGRLAAAAAFTAAFTAVTLSALSVDVARAQTPTPTSTVASSSPVLRVLMAGDSIMQGNNQPGVRVALHQRLSQTGVRFTFVGSKTSFWNGTFTEDVKLPAAPDNRMAAVGGLCLLADNTRGCGFNPVDSPQGVLGLVRETWAKGDLPDLYIVMAGINDRFCNLAPTQVNSEGITPCIQPFSERYRFFIDQVLARTPAALVVFSTGRDYQSADPFFDAQAPGLASLAAAYRADGKRVFFVDAWKGVTVKDMGDAVHPNERGAQLVAENYASVLVPLVLQQAATASAVSTTQAPAVGTPKITPKITPKTTQMKAKKTAKKTVKTVKKTVRTRTTTK